VQLRSDSMLINGYVMSVGYHYTRWDIKTATLLSRHVARSIFARNVAVV